jgi:integrase
VSEVDRQLVGEWIDKDLNKTDLKPKTKGWYLSALQSAWTYFMLHGMTHTNPFERMVSLVQLGKKGIEEERPPRPWTPDEIAKLKLADYADPIYRVSVIRLHSGARVEEACSLRASDIDLEANTMRIGGVTKTQSSQRTLPLHPVLQALMPALIDNATDDGYLFDMKPAGRDLKRSHNFSKRVTVGSPNTCPQTLGSRSTRSDTPTRRR